MSWRCKLAGAFDAFREPQKTNEDTQLSENPLHRLSRPFELSPAPYPYHDSKDTPTTKTEYNTMARSAAEEATVTDLIL